MASELEPTIIQLSHELQEFLELHRACRQETEVHWAALADRGQQLENQLSALWKSLEDDVTQLQENSMSGLRENEKPSQASLLEPSMSQRARASCSSAPTRPRDDAGTLEADQISQASFDSGKPGNLYYFATMLDIDDENRAAEEPHWVRMIHSASFDILVGVLIVINTIVMSFHLQYKGNILKEELLDKCEVCYARMPSVDMVFYVFEHIFTVMFAVELLLRLAADGWRYLKSIANIGDAMIVVISSFDSWVLSPMGSDAMANVGILRLLRLVKLSKVFRVMRVMKAFKPLRVLVTAVAASVGALIWSMTLLFVLELIGAIFLAQVIQPFIEDPELDHESRDKLWRRFGTWFNAMLTIFEVTMAPGGFTQYRYLVDDVHPLLGLFLVCYVCVVTFAVVRVITAMFLKATLAASEQDEEKATLEKLKQRKAYARQLEERVDSDNSGGISHEELFKWLQTVRMQEWLSDAGLQHEEAERLFRALDRTGSGEISFGEYVQALERMMQPPRAADLVVLLSESRQIIERVVRLESSWSVGTRLLASSEGAAANASNGTWGRSKSGPAYLDVGSSGSRPHHTLASPLLPDTFFTALVEKTAVALSNAIRDAMHKGSFPDDDIRGIANVMSPRNGHRPSHSMYHSILPGGDGSTGAKPSHSDGHEQGHGRLGGKLRHETPHSPNKNYLFTKTEHVAAFVDPGIEKAAERKRALLVL